MLDELSTKTTTVGVTGFVSTVTASQTLPVPPLFVPPWTIVPPLPPVPAVPPSVTLPPVPVPDVPPPLSLPTPPPGPPPPPALHATSALTDTKEARRSTLRMSEMITRPLPLRH